MIQIIRIYRAKNCRSEYFVVGFTDGAKMFGSPTRAVLIAIQSMSMYNYLDSIIIFSDDCYYFFDRNFLGYSKLKYK